MKNRARARKLALVAAEMLGTLLAVLVLFWLFYLFLSSVFPTATPLKELVEAGREPGRSIVEPKAEATLSALFRDVRYRRGNSVAWGGASPGMKLYSQDAVQTLDRSGASISFGPADLLTVGSNSLVVVTRVDAGDDRGGRSYRVQVEGEVTGSLSAARRLGMEFAAQGHVARIVPGAARFRFSRNGSDSASLAVYAGEVRVAGRGGVVRVPANYGVSLVKGVPVGSPVPLPAPPVLETEQALYRYRLLPPRVRFGWMGGNGEYRFQLSRDARFRRLLVDRKVKESAFATGKLEKGEYFWRVSRIEQGREGRFSSVGSCRLVQLLDSPRLEVVFPSKNAVPGPFRLSGSMEPGSRVFVNGIEVASGAEGRFERELQVKPGVNLIRVEAIDPAGNASYASRVVYGASGGNGTADGAAQEQAAR